MEGRDGTVNRYKEGAAFKPLNYSDPHGFGERFRPIFPRRHRTMKAILDNTPATVERIYVYGSSIRRDTATDSDLDLFLVGTVTNAELNQLYRVVPDGEKVDIMVETAEEFTQNLENRTSTLYEKVFEGGYKIYER
jgi:predicted nucleotidyltransferase